jgi:hypothetical protein
MSVKPLFDVDLRIAKLREQMAARKATLSTGIELDDLLLQRATLIAEIGKEQERPVEIGI